MMNCYFGSAHAHQFAEERRCADRRKEQRWAEYI